MNWWNILKDYVSSPQTYSDPMTEEEMKEIWDKGYPDNPHVMRATKTSGGGEWWYNVGMKWFVSFVEKPDGDKHPIAKLGFIDHDDFYLLGGIESPIYPGVARNLYNHRENFMDADKPKVALLNIKGSGQARWRAEYVKRGFDMNPEDVSDIPEVFVERFDKIYGRKNWGIRRGSQTIDTEHKPMTEEEQAEMDAKYEELDKPNVGKADSLEQEIHTDAGDSIKMAIGKLKMAKEHMEDAEMAFAGANIENTSITIENINKYVDEIQVIEAEIEQTSTWAITLRQTMAQDLNRLDAWQQFEMMEKSERWFSSLQN